MDGESRGSPFWLTGLLDHTILVARTSTFYHYKDTA
jgi:hypothetical protein